MPDKAPLAFPFSSLGLGISFQPPETNTLAPSGTSGLQHSALSGAVPMFRLPLTAQPVIRN
jgi:hypothetical protein